MVNVIVLAVWRALGDYFLGRTLNSTMLRLPRIKQDPKETQDLCKCRPICKTRRREWKGQVLDTSAELLIQRKPPLLCVKSWPKKVYPNGPCPIRTKRITIKERNGFHVPRVVRICQAPVDQTVDTTYLRYADLAIRLGATRTVHACCAFCTCGACCGCSSRGYVMHDAERALSRRADMRAFDSRVKSSQQKMRIMYDKI